MNQLTRIFAALGVLFICLFLTPVHYNRNGGYLRLCSIFSDGFIDWPRFFFYIALGLGIAWWAGRSRAVQDRAERLELFVRRVAARLLDLALICALASLLLPVVYLAARSWTLLYLVMPGIFAATWLGYYLLTPPAGSPGKRCFGLRQQNLQGGLASRRQRFFKELYYCLPILCGCVAIAIRLALPEPAYEPWELNDDGTMTEYRKFRLYWDVVLGSFAVVATVINVLTPLSMLVTRRGQALADLLTGIVVSRRSAAPSGAPVTA